MNNSIEVIRLSTDVVIVGGGTAGCYAAVKIKENSPETHVLIVEKAHIKRSGCLAAGVNAINAYINPGETPESFLVYVKKDSAGLIREDLVISIARRLNEAASTLESWGLPFVRDDLGRYKARGKRSVEIVGESIKPIIASAVMNAGVKVLNRTVATNFIMSDGIVTGVFAFSAREKRFFVINAKAVICATGGAAGIYRPNNEGSARHKMWYCPFNVGTGFAMGLRAGAEMTSFEMRFIALRVKDVISPTGTIAQGVRAKQINALGEHYQERYENSSTPMRTYAVVEENKTGRGPCYLDFTHVSDSENQRLKEAYLSMSPGMVLKWADEELNPNSKPVEVCGSEPYIVGGHGQAGFWVNVDRSTSLPGLYAAGDVAGGAPKKYVTGCLSEGEIAAISALNYIDGRTESETDETSIITELTRVFASLNNKEGFSSEHFEERLQKIMDEYAGGIGSNYELTEQKLVLAREYLAILDRDIKQNLQALDMYQLVKAHEVIDKVLVARVLTEHLLYRKETRWKSYQERIDYPKQDDLNWFKFVNSVYDAKSGTITIIERPVTGGENHEHTH